MPPLFPAFSYSRVMLRWSLHPCGHKSPRACAIEVALSIPCHFRTSLRSDQRGWGSYGLFILPVRQTEAIHDLGPQALFLTSSASLHIDGRFLSSLYSRSSITRTDPLSGSGVLDGFVLSIDQVPFLCRRRLGYATHLLEAGADLRTIQILMGHERLEDTTVYLQLSRRHLHAAVNPLEQIALPAVDKDRKR